MKLQRDVPGWARQYVGIKFREKGRTRGEGVDCWGLVRLLYAERRGIHLPSLQDGYAGVGDAGGIAGLFARQVDQDRLWAIHGAAEAHGGDLAVFRVGRENGHVGVMVARGWMVHALDGTDSCLERLDHPMWAPRLLHVLRYAGPVRVSGRPRPFRDDVVRVDLPAGLSVTELLAAAGIEATPYLSVFVGDRPVAPQAWPHVRPKPGRTVTVAATPLGGKNGLRLVASIAVLAAAIAAPYALAYAGVAGLTATSATGAVSLTTLGTFVSAGVGIAGTLAVSALIPPPKPRFSESLDRTSHTITGGRNEARPYGSVPLPLGRHRMVPLYGAVPYTEVAGDDTYFRNLFDLGTGPVETSDLRIGTTPINEYEGVEYEIREGRPGDEPLRLYPGTVLEQGYSVLLEQSAGFTVRTSDLDADELSVDVTFPSGLVRFQPNGDRSTAAVAVDIEYSPAGLNVWTPINMAAPDFSRGLDFMFRTPEVELGGTGTGTGEIAWGLGFAGAKPSYLPATNFSWEATAWVRVTTGGVHAFGIDTSDAGELRVDGRVVASWYGSHGTAGAGTPDYAAHQGTLTLTAGWHQIQLRISASSTTGAAALGWKRPGDVAFATIPATSIYRQARRGPGTANGYSYRWFDTSAYSSSVLVSADRPEQIRRTISWAVPTGQYDIRVRRVTIDQTDTAIVDKVYLTALRTIRNSDPIKAVGHGKLALRIRANDQLNGVIDQLNLVVHSIVPDWDAETQAWVERASSNPASLYLAVLRGRGQKRPIADSRIHWAAFQRWHEDCEAKGLEFNGIIDTSGTVAERLRDIASAGRASPGWYNGLHSVVQDKPQTVMVQHFTPRNSWGFKGRKVFSELPHALRVQFFDKESGWERRERIVLDDGYQIEGLEAFGNARPDLPPATVFETFELFGVTSADEAFKHGRYHIAVARLRPEAYEFNCDIEHLVCTRGDMVLVTHDVPLWGSGYGRIAALRLDTANNLVGVVLDDPVTMDLGVEYAIRVRLEDGTSFIRAVETVEGVQNELAFTGPISPNDARPMVRDLFMFGVLGRETRELVVRSIEYDKDLAARLMLVDHSPGIHLADVGTIPPWDPGITLPPTYENRPETPVIESIRSDDLVMIRDSDGSLRPRMLLTLRRQSGRRPIATMAMCRTRPKPGDGSPPVGPWNSHPIVSIDSNQVSIENVQEGVTYQIRLRTLTDIGQASDWVEAEHTVVGKAAPPPDVQSFRVARLSDGTRRYSWVIADPGDVPPDLAGVVIRFGRIGTVWESMTALHEGILQASPSDLNEPQEGTWAFGIKAIDTSGNLSLNPTYTEAALGPARLEGVAFSQDDGFLNWPGTKTDCHDAGDGTLEADDTTTWDTIASFGATSWALWDRWNLRPKSPITYESVVLDAGFVFPFSPDAIATVDGDLRIDVAWSTDGVLWTFWQEVSTVRATVVEARYLKARVTVQSSAPFPVPVIRRLTVLMRAMPVIHELQDVNTAVLDPRFRLGVGDIRLPIPLNAFRVIRQISITFNGMGAGWSYEMVDRDTTIGPRVRLYNADQELAHAVIDAVIRGL